jgi:hypothetical protein
MCTEQCDLQDPLGRSGCVAGIARYSRRRKNAEDIICSDDKARGHALLEEKQLKFHIERYRNIADLWSSYALRIDGKQVARGIHSIQAIKETGGWRVTGIMVQAESTTEPLPKKYLP